MARPNERDSLYEQLIRNTSTSNTGRKIARRHFIKGAALAGPVIIAKPLFDRVDAIIKSDQQTPQFNAINTHAEQLPQTQEKPKVALGNNLIIDSTFQAYDIIPYNNEEGRILIPDGWHEIYNNYNHAKLIENAGPHGENVISSEVFVENGDLKRTTWSTFPRDVNGKSQYFLSFSYKIEGEDGADVTGIKPMMRIATLRSNTTPIGPGISEIFSKATPNIWLPEEKVLNFPEGTSFIIPQFSAISENPIVDDKKRRMVQYTNIYIGRLIPPDDPEYPDPLKLRGSA